MSRVYASKNEQIAALELFLSGITLVEIAHKTNRTVTVVQAWHAKNNWAAKRRSFLQKLEAARESQIIATAGESCDIAVLAARKTMMVLSANLDSVILRIMPVLKDGEDKKKTATDVVITFEDRSEMRDIITLMKDCQSLQRLSSPAFDREQGDRILTALSEHKRLNLMQAVEE